ncbi:MAG: hypothetical protein AAF970_05620 [Bacteroidota bacterium]
MPRVASKKQAPRRSGPSRRTGQAVKNRRRAGSASSRAADWTFSGFLQAQNEAQALPSWRDLQVANERAPRATKGTRYLSRLSTARFTVLVLALAVASLFYIGHIQATDAVLTSLQQAEKEQRSLNLRYNQVKARYDQATSPTVIYRRAQELGLREGAQPRRVLTPVED